MLGLFAGMILPVAALVVAAAVLPRRLARRLGGSAGALALNAALSTLGLLALAAALFLALYALRDPRVLTAVRVQPSAALVHFVALGGMAGLIWGPVMLVSLISPPRRRDRQLPARGQAHRQEEPAGPSEG